MQTPAPLPMPLLETLLRLSPLDLLLFDTALICRYAALTDSSLIRPTAGTLIGQPAAAIFPAGADDLHAALALAAAHARGARYRSYRVTHAEVAASTSVCWSVLIEPVVLQDYRGSEEFRGVLVTLADVHDLADEVDRLQAEVGHLQERLTQAERAVAIAQEERRQLRTIVRTALAPVVGYLQVLSRRPWLFRERQQETVLDTQVLPVLHRLVEDVDTATTVSPSQIPDSRE
jgi:hypothetical protein